MSNPCGFEGCKNGRWAKGLCSAHYRQQRKGYPLHVLGYNSASETERFFQKVIKSDGCWTWGGAMFTHGYGRALWQGKVGAVAHRVSWMIHNGPIPDGMLVCHSCDNPPCVRPDHLFLGTHRDNMKDMLSKGRQRHDAGEACNATKLTAEAVIDIRARSAVGVRSKVLAAIHGVTSDNINRIVNRNTWKHIP